MRQALNVVEQTKAKGSACSGDFRFLVIIRRVSQLFGTDRPSS